MLSISMPGTRPLLAPPMLISMPLTVPAVARPAASNCMPEPRSRTSLSVGVVQVQKVLVFTPA